VPEVGNATVPVFPTFRGFRRAVSSEVDGAARESSTGFARIFSRTGEQSGRQVGQGFRGAFSTAARGVGTEELKKLEGGVASASKALSAARLKEQDAAGKVRVAETALAEARSKGEAGSSRVVAAEERLATAQRDLTSVQETVKASSDRLADSKQKLAEASEEAARAAAEEASAPSGGGGSRFKDIFNGVKEAASSTLSSVRSAFSTGLEGIKTTLGDLGTFAGTTFKTIAGIATGILGASLVSGFNRLVSIENAQAKLKGLGNDAASVTTIMENALASVRGTAFGLGDAAGVAAAAVAAGVKPGAELERTLKLVADAATIAGSDLSSMGSIFNKVAASGKLQGDVIAQLQDMGVPVLQFVADQIGATAEETAKLASEGEIGFDTFRRAMEAGLGGAALESGNTTMGAFANVKAALGRLGAAILDGPFKIFGDLFRLVTKGLDGLTDKVKPFSEAIGPKLTEVFDSTVSKFTDGFERFKDVLRQVGDALPKDAFKNILDVLGPEGIAVGLSGIAGLFGPLLTQLPIVGGLFAGLTGPVGLLVGGLGALLAISPELREALGEFGQGALSLVTSLFNDLSDTASSSGLQELLPRVADILTQITQGATELLPSLEPIVGKLVELSGLVFDTVLDALDLLFAPTDTAGMDAKSESVDGFKVVLEGIEFVLDRVIGRIEDLNFGIGLMQGVFNGVDATTLNKQISSSDTELGKIADTASDVGFNIAQFVAQSGINFRNFATDVGTNITNAINSVKGIGIQVGSAFTGVGTWLVDSGKSLIQGFITGIQSMVQAAKNAVNNVLAAIREFFPFSPAKTGPFSGSGWTLFSGRSLVDGLADGMGERIARLRAQALAVTEAATVGGSATIGGTAAAGGPLAAGTPGGAFRDLHIHEVNDPYGTALVVSKYQEEAFV
jgi:tape measure domain-containing protein